MKKSIKIGLISIIAFLVVLSGGFYIYTLDYYRADDIALTVFSTKGSPVITSDQPANTQGKFRVFYPDDAKKRETGLIFYPGGKVEAMAYAPLMEKLSQKGVVCVLVSMPFNLAVFDVNAADQVYGMLPEVKNWYIGGHSLGGAMASSYQEKNNDKLKGMILMGAYPLKETDFPTLTLYGSEDGVLNRDKLVTAKTRVEIAGGNHAYYGNYGEQKGDGAAKITRDEQQAQVISMIVEFISAK